MIYTTLLICKTDYLKVENYVHKTYIPTNMWGRMVALVVGMLLCSTLYYLLVKTYYVNVDN
jgi:hypothetical protein